MLKKKLKILIADYGDNDPLLLKRADEAFYASKNKERDCYQFFFAKYRKITRLIHTPPYCGVL